MFCTLSHTFIRLGLSLPITFRPVSVLLHIPFSFPEQMGHTSLFHSSRYLKHAINSVLSSHTVFIALVTHACASIPVFSFRRSSFRLYVLVSM
ncbi:hypothetical protein EI94DRAFT_649002 [Lactarius quietus]|nr:hypothetical protein EI94DRAFT_649002 [Lactarius quietus]